MRTEEINSRLSHGDRQMVCCGEGSRRSLARGGCSRGFTLIEMLAVIAIIGLIAGILLGALQKARQRALRMKAATEARDLVKAAQEFLLTYPAVSVGTLSGDVDAGKVAILQGDDTGINPEGIKFYQFPLGAAVNGLRDPWGNLYHMSLSSKSATNNWSYATRVYFQHRRRAAYE